MDFTKYVKNKDLQITNDDIDIEKLTNDLRKGYTNSNDLSAKITAGINEEKAKWNPKESKDYTDLQNSYDTAIKDLNTANETIKTKNLELEMMSRGFNKDDFKEVSNLRNSLYADEKDDSKAIESIATRFKDTYFKVEDNSNQKKDYDNGYLNGGSDSKKKPIKVDRNTSLSDLRVKKN